MKQKGRYTQYALGLQKIRERQKAVSSKSVLAKIKAYKNQK